MIRDMDVSWRTEYWDRISAWFDKAFAEEKPTRKDSDLIDLIRVLCEDEKRIDREAPKEE